MNPEAEASTAKKPQRRRWWRIPAIVLGVIVGLILLILVAVSIILTPERLTRLVEKYGTEYLQDGRVEAKRIELTIWSSFPHTTLDVDSLRVLCDAPGVPQEGDTVMAIDRFHGRLNLPAILIGSFRLSHVELEGPRFTLWKGTDSLTNLCILPPSEEKQEEEKKEEKKEPLVLPDIRLSRFTIGGNARVRYISVPDSIDATVHIKPSELKADEKGVVEYDLSLTGKLGALAQLPRQLQFGIGGGIGWDSGEPLGIQLYKLKLDVDSLQTVTSANADFSDKPTLKSLEFELKPATLQYLARLANDVPQLKGVVPKEVRSDCKLSISAKLHEPYELPTDSIITYPKATARVKITDGPVSVPEWHLDLTKVGADLEANVLPKGLDASTVELKKLEVEFPGSKFSLKGKATNLQKDPLVEGKFKGDINFGGLDSRLWTVLAMRLKGLLDANLDFRFHASDLTDDTFHRITANGEVNLKHFEAIIPADTLAAGTGQAKLEFGSADKLHGADSLMTATLHADSIWVNMAEMTARMTKARIKVGCENRAITGEDNTIVPMGIKVEAEKLRYASASDSTRALMRDLKVVAAVSRFKGNGRRPVLGGDITVKRVVYADGVNRMSLRDTKISARAHLNPPKQRPKLTDAQKARFKQRRDSLLLAETGYERIDYGVDRSAIRLLRKWDVRGSVTAQGGRFFSPAFPLRCRLGGLNFQFNPDSLMLRDLKLKAGRSDFSLKGSVTNMQRALGRKNSRQPLRIRFDLNSDTINVNQLVQAAFRGSANAAKSDKKAVSADLEMSDAQLEQLTESQQKEEMLAIVVPQNIDASFEMNAKNVVYSDMLLHDFHGLVEIANGAANLYDLSAKTDIGSANVNLFYFAPTRKDVNVGISLDLNRFDISKVTQIVPGLDTIMPLLNDLGGYVTLGLGATTDVDSALNVNIPTLRALMRVQGDSLRVLDEKTFKVVSKWLLFRNKKKNQIDHMDVELAVEDSKLMLYPFMFDFDRYRLGVMGSNDLDMNMNYHVSILKSPIPFKFGINIKGKPDKLKVRLGRARVKKEMTARETAITDTTRINLVQHMRDLLHKGTKAARLAPIDITKPEDLPTHSEEGDTITAADSLFFMQQGLLEGPAPVDSLQRKQ